MQQVTMILSVIILLGGAGGVLVGAYKLIRMIDDMKRSVDHRKQENVLLIEGQFVILDGLKQLGANGKVTEMHERLQKYVIEH